LTLPPLRHRLGDLPALVAHVMQQDGRHAMRGISPEALEVLGTYEFPGNVRELIGILRKAVMEATISGGNVLLPSHLPPGSAATLPPPLLNQSPNILKNATSQAKAAYIRRALKEHKTITAAAAHLGFSREGLSRLMSSLGIKNSQET
jgi:transcriptional regulator with GAF, ATPase, and Fis domain